MLPLTTGYPQVMATDRDPLRSVGVRALAQRADPGRAVADCADRGVVREHRGYRALGGYHPELRSRVWLALRDGEVPGIRDRYRGVREASGLERQPMYRYAAEVVV